MYSVQELKPSTKKEHQTLSNAIDPLQRDLARVVGNLPISDACMNPAFGGLKPYTEHSSDNHQLMALALRLCTDKTYAKKIIQWWIDTLLCQMAEKKNHRGRYVGWMAREFLSRIYVLEHLIPILVVRWWAFKNNHSELIRLTNRWLSVYWTTVQLTSVIGTTIKNTFSQSNNFTPASVWFGARSFETTLAHMDFWHASWFNAAGMELNFSVPQWVKNTSWAWAFFQNIRVGNPNWHGRKGSIQYNETGFPDVSAFPPVRADCRICLKDSGVELWHKDTTKFSNATAPGYASIIDTRNKTQKYLTVDSGSRDNSQIWRGHSVSSQDRIVAENKFGQVHPQSLGETRGSGYLNRLPGKELAFVVWNQTGAYYVASDLSIPTNPTTPPNKDNKWEKVKQAAINRFESSGPTMSEIEGAWWDVGGLINTTKKL